VDETVTDRSVVIQIIVLVVMVVASMILSLRWWCLN